MITVVIYLMYLIHLDFLYICNNSRKCFDKIITIVINIYKINFIFRGLFALNRR